MKSYIDFTSNEDYKRYLRVYFIGLAMQGIIAGKAIAPKESNQEATKAVAMLAISIADEIISQLDLTVRD